MPPTKKSAYVTAIRETFLPKMNRINILSFKLCCPRDCVSRHNGGTSGATLKPLRVDSALSTINKTIYKTIHKTI